MNENPKSNQSELPKNVEGHQPLLLERRGEEIWTADGRKLVPDFKIGPDKWHIDVFVEYERTFGRGKAYAITHHPFSSPMYENEKRDYFELASQISYVVNCGTEAECKNLIEKLREYRNKYPSLFDDVSANRPNLGGISWKNIS